VRDAAAVLDVVREPFPGDTVVAPAPARPNREEVGAEPGRLRIGLLTTNPLDTGDVHPDCVAAAEDAGRLLDSLGHHVEASHPHAAADAELIAQFGAVWAAGVAAFLDDFSALVGAPVEPGDVEPLTAALAEAGRAVTAAEYLLAIRAMEETTRQIAAWWAEGFDLLLTPTLAEPPLPLGTLDARPEDPMFGFVRAAQFVPFTPPFNITGQPAISLPLFWNDEGLPIGSQLVAAYGREDVLVRVAAQLEAARPWADRRPPVHT
jgi:amidase